MSACTCAAGWGAGADPGCPMHGTVKRTRIGEGTVPLTLLFSDRVLDRTLDELTDAAGHERNTDALGLARWDLKAALRTALDAARPSTESGEASA